MGVDIRDFLENRQFERDYVIGVVKDNKDMPEGLPGHIPEGTAKKRPTYGVGRLKVAIPGLSDEIDPEDLPWINTLSALGSGTSAGVGKFIVPAEGSKVILKKIGEDEYDWAVVGEVNSTKDETTDYDENYPETWGFRDKTGTKTIINMKTEISHLEHCSGSYLEIIKSGSVEAEIVDDLTVHVKDNTEFKLDGWVKETIGEYFEQEVAETYKETVKGDFTSVLKANRETTIDGNETAHCKGERTITIDDNDVLTVNGQLTITCTGGQLTIASSSGGITIGASTSIDMVAGTAVNITAPAVNIIEG